MAEPKGFPGKVTFTDANHCEIAFRVPFKGLTRNTVSNYKLLCYRDGQGVWRNTKIVTPVGEITIIAGRPVSPAIKAMIDHA